MAVEYANKHDVALFGFADDSTWWPVNKAAKKLARGSLRKVADAWNDVETKLDQLADESFPDRHQPRDAKVVVSMPKDSSAIEPGKRSYGTGFDIAKYQSGPNAGVWQNEVKLFLKRHWRLIGAIIATLLIPTGIATIIDPQPGQSLSEGIWALIVGLLAAPGFWWLYMSHRQSAKGRPPPAEPSEGSD